MHNDIEKVIYSEEQIKERVAEIGKQISEDYKGKELVLVSILRGSFVFLSDLIRNISIPCEIDFLSASSYGDRVTSSGKVVVNSFLSSDPKGKHLLLVEDILDSGFTLSRIIPLTKALGCESVKVAALLDKPERRKANVDLDYRGFTVNDYFLVGYGLDYADKYRNLPYIGALDPKIYTK